jgi:hypothetical protein
VLWNDTVPSQVAYSDLIEILNNNEALVSRTWTISDVLSGNQWSYVQQLYVFADLTKANACAHRGNGDPIPDVIMKPGFLTDNSGCTELDVSAGEPITPSKSGNIQEGVDILDAILLSEMLYGYRPLTPREYYAADITNDSLVSTHDLLLLLWIINGQYTQDEVWRFHDARYIPDTIFWPFPDPPSDTIEVGLLNRQYNFLGVKLGDLDNSYQLNDLQPTTTIEFFAQDEILNNGESYAVTMQSDKTLAIQGLKLELDANSDKVYFSSIVSTSLPGFDVSKHVKVEGNQIRIQYIAPIELMQTGAIRIEPGEPILEFHLSATGNGILSQELKLADEEDQYMKMSSAPDRIGIRLIWEDQIISRIKNATLEGVHIFPIPAHDFLNIRMDQHRDPLSYYISGLDGRHLRSGSIEEGARIDISEFMNGLYILTLVYADGRSITKKISIQR